MKRRGMILLGLMIVFLLCRKFCFADEEQEESTTDVQLKIQTGHSLWLTSVAFSPNGRFVLTGSEDGIALLWEVETGREIRCFRGHKDGVLSVAYSPDGRYVLTGSGDETARLWEVSTGRETRCFEGHRADVDAVAFSPDGRFVLTGSMDRTARLWDVESEREVRHFDGHANWIESVAFSPDGRYVATAGWDWTIRLWDTTTGREMRRFQGDAMTVYSVSFSPDGLYVLTGDDERRACLWEVKTGREVRRFEGHEGEVYSVAFSPDGRYVLTGSLDNTARLWDVSTGHEVQRYEEHTEFGIASVAFSPDGKYVLTGGDKSAHLWGATTGHEIGDFKGDVEWVTSVTFSPDGLCLLTGSWDKTAHLWESSTGREVRRYEGYGSQYFSWVFSAAFSPKGDYLVTGGTYREASLLEVETGRELRRFKGHDSDVESVEFSPDGRYVLTGSRDKTARLWETATGRAVQRFEGHNDEVTSISFSPDGHYVLTGSKDRTARLWETATGREVRRFEGHTDWINSVSFSTDGHYVLTGSHDKTARLWDARTALEVKCFEGHTGFIYSVVFSPDGRYVATGSYDQTARLWETTTGHEVCRFVGHSGLVRSISFSPDGRYVLTGSYDNTARLWDAATGEELAQLVSFTDGSWAVVDRQGRFDAYNGGDVDHLYWVVGSESIGLEQLKERYYEPGLLAKVIGHNKEPLRDAQAFTQVALYPAVQFQTPEGKQPKLGIKLTNRGGGIGKVVVLINGKEVTADARGEAVDPNAKIAELSIDIKSHPYLIPGKKNRIEVKAYNAEGYLSSRGMIVEYEAPGKAPFEIPTLWAVVSGVSDYSGETIDLRYAAKDARDMATALQLGGSRLFGADRVELRTLTTLATDTKPTKENLRQAFKDLQAAKSWDILVVYLAGHGVAQGDEYYYLTQEARSADLTDPAVRERVAISSGELVEWIKQSPSTLQVMILDTCAAGAFEKSLSEVRDISSDQIRALDRMKDRTGFHVLMGSAADRVSYEATQYEQGLLTYALLKGMKGAALREEQFVDVGTLFNSAVDEVPRLARNIGGIQSPRIAAPKGTSFDIGQLTEEDRRKIPLAQAKPFLLPPAFLNPEEGFDNLGLTSLVRKKLRDDSYALGRGEARWLPFVYVDADQLAGAILPSGTYSVSGQEIEVRMVLVRDKTRLTALEVSGDVQDLEALSARILEKASLAISKLD